MSAELDALLLEVYKKEAAALGISLTEYLLFKLLDRLDDLHVITTTEQ